MTPKPIQQVAQELAQALVELRPGSQVFLVQDDTITRPQDFDPREIFGSVTPETPLHNPVMAIYESCIPGQPFKEYSRRVFYTWGDIKYLTPSVHAIVSDKSFKSLELLTVNTRATYQTLEHAYEKHMAAIDEEAQE